MKKFEPKPMPVCPKKAAFIEELLGETPEPKKTYADCSCVGEYHTMSCETRYTPFAPQEENERG